MSKMEQLDLFGGKPTEIHTREEWFRAFSEYCYNQYEEHGDNDGSYCCGYHWCCDRCKCELQNGCDDCVATIEEILIENGVQIDYSDFNFEYWERKAKELL